MSNFRIKVEDAVRHLKSIAEKESVVIEEEGLNVIAQKADGAMRDALSIFDQIVSFSGKEITFESVIQNLNVLDYDYYFKMVDSFLEGKVTDVLVMLNEIIEKGFDGHHFVAGLSAHIRDVLVGKDPVTIQLLEVSDSVKQKYVEQSKRCPLDFLYDALAVLNQCDISYKTSQNPRLLIELSLIQLSQIVELKKKGLRLNLKSKKILKIFVDGESIGSVRQVVTAVKASAQSTEVVSDPNNGYKAREKKDVVTVSASKSNFAPSVSIKQALKKGIPRNTPISKPKDKPATNGVEEVITGKEPITKEKIEAKLKEFIVSRGRSERVKLALGVIKPEVNGETDVVFQVSNPLQEDDVNSAVNEVKNYLRRELNNSNIEITVKITKAKLSKKVYTETDRFNYLCEKNPALGLLKQKLSLDFE